MEEVAKYLVLTLVWFLLASPVLGILYFVSKKLSQPNINTILTNAIYSIILMLLIAPIPTPIITFFIPNIYYLFGFQSYIAEIYDWYIISFIFTLVLSSVAVKIILRKQANSTSDCGVKSG